MADARTVSAKTVSDPKAEANPATASDGHQPARSVRVDPAWPDVPHPVSEVAATLQGALSPFGDVEFPVPAEDLPYEHPVTKINK